MRTSANRPSRTGRSSAPGRGSSGGGGAPPPEGGFPLPLAASWSAIAGSSGGWGPDYIKTLHQAGSHVLHTFMWPDSNEAVNAGGTAYFDLAIQYCAANNLPVCFMSTQWEWKLHGYNQDFTYVNRTWASGTNPNVFDLSHNLALTEPGNLLTVTLDPLGSVAPWQEEGALWTSGTHWSYVQAQYPNPSLVLLLSNNEVPRHRWGDTGVLAPESTARYFEAHGSGQTPEFKRTVMGNGYASLYGAFIATMRANLATQPWRDAALMAGYGVAAGAWMQFGGWSTWDVAWEGGDPDTWMDWGPLAWQGGSANVYVNNGTDQSDYWPWTRVHPNNLVHLRDWIRATYPDYWYEVSVWDGSEPGHPGDRRAAYAALGQTWSPARFIGTQQYVMWMLRPVCVRDYRGAVQTRSQLDYEDCFLELVAACDRVHNNAILEQFWRFGTNVPNTADGSPWTSNIPAGYETFERWFQLATNLDPPRPWGFDTTEIPVFALAHVIGTTPSREWLLYAHSPLQQRTGVTITVPGFGDVTNLTIPVAGGFWHLEEQGSTVTLLSV